MARLSDLIMGRWRFLNQHPKELAAIEVVREILPTIPVVVVSNVWEYYMTTRGNEGTWCPRDDFPCVAPPFPEYFMEFQASDIRDPQRWALGGMHRMGVLFSGARTDTGWQVTAVAVYSAQSGYLHMSPVFVEYEVVDDGTFSKDPARVLCLRDVPGDTEEAKDTGRSLITLLYPFWLATSFMHCKNVGQTKHTPPALTVKQARANPHPFMTYATINIQPMQRVLREEGGDGHNGLRKALHICRGHFVHYVDKGLFGKYKGRFWIPQHARGNVDLGTVHQSYNVSPGANP